MRPDVRTATERAWRLRERVSGLPAAEASLAQIEDVLTGGYAVALAADDWSTRAEQRLHGLIDNASHAGRGRDIRALALEHDTFQQELFALRRELSELHREHARVLSATRVASG